jgi:hypothetical protein
MGECEQRVRTVSPFTPACRTRVPRFFFDLYDGGFQADAVGTEYDTLERASHEAMGAVAEIAGHSAARTGRRQSLVVLVRDETGQHVFMAGLDLVGTPLGD